MVFQPAARLFFEPAATTFGQQQHQIDERQAETTHQYGFPRLDGRIVDVGGVAGRVVREAVACGEIHEFGFAPVRFGVEMPDGEQDRVHSEGFRTVLQPQRLRLAVFEPHRAGPVLDDLDPGREPRPDLAVEPGEIGALQPSCREVITLQCLEFDTQAVVDPDVERALADQPHPLDQRRAGPDRTVDLHRVVGEDRDVLRHGVHPQQRRLLVPPDPSGAGRERIDEMHHQPPFTEQLCGIRAEPFEYAHPARTGTDHREHVGEVCGTHEAEATPGFRCLRGFSKSGTRCHS